MLDKLWMWIAFHLPHRVVYWAHVRVVAKATTGEYSTQIVPELMAVDAMKRWGESA